jgi:hypothetical protein
LSSAPQMTTTDVVPSPATTSCTQTEGTQGRRQWLWWVGEEGSMPESTHRGAPALKRVLQRAGICRALNVVKRLLKDGPATPAHLTCDLASSTSIFAAGCATVILLRMVAPSLVMMTSPLAAATCDGNSSSSRRAGGAGRRAGHRAGLRVAHGPASCSVLLPAQHTHQLLLLLLLLLLGWMVCGVLWTHSMQCETATRFCARPAAGAAHMQTPLLCQHIQKHTQPHIPSCPCPWGRGWCALHRPLPLLPLCLPPARPSSWLCPCEHVQGGCMSVMQDGEGAGSDPCGLGRCLPS